jgi:hypothetical protein
MVKLFITLLILLLSFNAQAKPLKATKDKILYSQTYDKKEFIPNVGFVDVGSYTSYDYISDVEIKDKDYTDKTGKKYKEDKTKRTTNSRQYLIKTEGKNKHTIMIV